MTPVLQQQFRTSRLRFRCPPASALNATDRPIGVTPEACKKNVLWATVSDEVEANLMAGTTKLRPQDWKSGDKLWVVEVIAPFGGAEEMVKDLKEKVFPTKAVHFLAVNKDGKQVRVL